MQARDLTGDEDAPDLIGTACSVNHGAVDYSTRALSRAVNRYLRTGKLPPRVPRIERDSRGQPARGAYGLAQGGIRHPHVEVPLAHNSARGCALWGTFRPWSSERIRGLYPTHRAYARKVSRWTRKEVRRGWMLRSDRADVLANARGYRRPWTAEGCEPCIPPQGL